MSFTRTPHRGAPFRLLEECSFALNSTQANWLPLSLQETIDTLVSASSLPLSILIVGIGESPELSKMEVRLLHLYRICSSALHILLPIQFWQLLLHARFGLQCSFLLLALLLLYSSFRPCCIRSSFRPCCIPPPGPAPEVDGEEASAPSPQALLPHSARAAGVRTLDADWAMVPSLNPTRRRLL